MRCAKRLCAAVRRCVGALGYSVEVLAPEQGLSWRGTSDDKLISGDVLRKLLVQLENHVDLDVPLRLPPCEPSLAVKVRQRASRRAVKGPVNALRQRRVRSESRDADGVGQRPRWAVAFGVCRRCTGRRIPIVDTTHVEVALESGTYSAAGW